MAQWIQDDFTEGFNLTNDAFIRRELFLILFFPQFLLGGIPKRLNVYSTWVDVVAHWHSFILAVSLEFPLKRRTSINRCGAFIMGSQVLPRACQEVRCTFSMATVDWHVEPIRRYVTGVIAPFPTQW
jgi:hypothetical protein